MKSGSGGTLWYPLLLYALHLVFSYGPLDLVVLQVWQLWIVLQAETRCTCFPYVRVLSTCCSIMVLVWQEQCQPEAMVSSKISRSCAFSTGSFLMAFWSQSCMDNDSQQQWYWYPQGFAMVVLSASEPFSPVFCGWYFIIDNKRQLRYSLRSFKAVLSTTELLLLAWGIGGGVDGFWR